MRRQITILALLALVSTLVAPAAQAQATDSYTSPTYGYTVTWDPSVWRIEPSEELVAAGPDALDRMVLIHGTSQLYVEGARRYGGDAGACVQGEFDLMAQSTNISDIAPIPDLAAGGVDHAADARALTLTLASGESIRLADYVECQRLDQDSVVIATLVTTRDALDAELALARPVIDAIVLPGNRAEVSATFTEDLFTAQLAAPLAGPLEGDLALEADALVALPAGVDTADFAATAAFANPYAASEHDWDIGFAFRQVEENQGFRLIVDSAGRWYLVEGLGPLIASGEVSGLATGAGETNTIDLVARGDRGGFAVNGVFVAELDLSARPEAGDVRAGSGFFVEDVVAGETTAVSGFTVWPLATQPAQFDAAAFSAAIGAARATTPVAGPTEGTLDAAAGQVALTSANVSVADFAARVRWAVPGGGQPWDVGFAFRDQPDGRHYRLTFDHTGAWALGIGAEPKLAMGQAPSLALADGAVNTVELVVVGDNAGFSVNGEFVSGLDVSQLRQPGDVWFGTGFSAGNVAPGASLRYRDFIVWDLTGLPSATPVAATPVAATPVAETPVSIETVASPAAATPAPAEQPTITPTEPAPTVEPPPTVEAPATAPPTIEAPPTAAPSPTVEATETASPTPAPTEVPLPTPPAATPPASAAMIAVDVREQDGSGVAALATITEVEGEAYVNLAVRGSEPGALAVIHEGSCADLGPPAFLLSDPDAGGRSKTPLGVPVDEVRGGRYALAIHPGFQDLGTVLACGDIGG